MLLDVFWGRRISSIHHVFQCVSHVRGVGASSIAAAFNGAYVTLVDAFVTDELLDNLEANIGMTGSQARQTQQVQQDTPGALNDSFTNFTR